MDHRAVVLYFIVVTIACQTLQQKSSTPIDVETLLHLMNLTFHHCKGIEWCTIQNNDQLMWDFRNCCPACSCDDDCALSRTCCPDYVLSKYLDGKQFDNIVDVELAVKNESIAQFTDWQGVFNIHENSELNHTDCIRAKLHNMTLTSTKSKAYPMVSKCLDFSEFNENKRSKCEMPGSFDNSGILEDFIPVQSFGTRIVYRNRFCAECNGLTGESVYPWEVYLKKHTLPGFGFTEQLISANDIYDLGHLEEYNNYDFYFEPRSGFEPQTCHITYIRTCKAEKAEMGSSQSLTERTCQQYEYPINIWSQRRHVVLNNIACFFCNELNVGEFMLCGAFYLWEVHQPFIAKVRPPDVRRNDLRPDGHELQYNLSQTCSLGHLHDKEVGTCRKVYCPCGMSEANGSCVPLFESIYDKLYGVTVLVKPLENIREAALQDYQTHLSNYFGASLLSTQAFAAERVLIFAPKQVNGASTTQHCVHVIFSALNKYPSFVSVLHVVKKLFIGIKHIGGNLRSVRADMSVTNKFSIFYNKAIDKSTGIEYEIIPQASDTVRDIVDDSTIPISVCNFCFMVEVLPTDIVSTQSSRHSIKIKRTGEVILKGEFTRLHPGRMVLACIASIVPTDNDVPTGPSLNVSSESLSEQEHTDDTLRSVVTVTSIAVLLCAIAGIRQYCVRRSQQSTGEPTTSV